MALEEAGGSRIYGSTSDASAIMRARGALDPDPALRCPDTLARAFIADIPAARLGDTRLGLRIGRWLTDQFAPGAHWYELARVRHFDALLLEAVAGGARQVVILGAGLDSRAYRFADQLRDLRVFEVDHPVTAARKRARVLAALARVPEEVTYVTADLVDENLGRRLGEEGFDPGSSVFVLWCGVTMYLDPESFDAVLAWVAGRPPGSSVAFDYDFDAFIAGSDRFHGAARIRRAVERSGEPHTFGLDPAGLGEFLGERGLVLDSNLLPDDLADRYLRAGDGSLAGRPSGFMGIATASVGAPE